MQPTPPIAAQPMETESADEAERVAALLDRGDELRRAKAYDDAIQTLLDALEIGVSKASVYFRLGNVYYDMDDMSRAEYAYKRAIECDEEFASAYNNLGVVYKRTGRIAESVKHRKKAYRLEMTRPKGLGDGEGRPNATGAQKRRTLVITFAIVIGLIVLFRLL